MFKLDSDDDLANFRGHSKAVKDVAWMGHWPPFEQLLNRPFGYFPHGDIDYGDSLLNPQICHPSQPHYAPPTRAAVQEG